MHRLIHCIYISMSVYIFLSEFIMKPPSPIQHLRVLSRLSPFHVSILSNSGKCAHHYHQYLYSFTQHNQLSNHISLLSLPPACVSFWSPWSCPHHSCASLQERKKNKKERWKKEEDRMGREDRKAGNMKRQEKNRKSLM